MGSRDRIPLIIGWLAYSLPFIAWIDTKVAAYKAKATTIELSGWPGLLYDWQQGWGGIFAAGVAGAAAYLTIRATREAAKEQVSAADRQIEAAKLVAIDQVAVAKEVAQMQVSAAAAALEQERTRSRHAELVAIDRNLGMQIEMVRAWRQAFTDLRAANEERIAYQAYGQVQNFELPITLNITTDQCNLLGVSDSGLVALGDLIATSMRCRFAIQHMQRTQKSHDVISLHAAVPGILDRLVASHSARRTEVKDSLKNLVNGI